MKLKKQKLEGHALTKIELLKLFKKLHYELSVNSKIKEENAYSIQGRAIINQGKAMKVHLESHH
jgi:hypothetical protein